MLASVGLNGWFDEFVAQYERALADPLNYGQRPHVFQELMHMSPAKLTLFVAANRLGKSVGGMREVLWRATGTHPYRPFKPIEMIWCGFPSYPFFRETTRPHFTALCPKDRLIQFHETEYWAKIRREDGGVCTIFFKPYEQGRDKWQGAAVDFMWLDEEPPEEIFREGLARLIDKNGDMLLTFTPVSGMGWLYDRLYLPGVAEWTKPVEERDINVIQAGLATRDPEREFEVGEPLVPHLTREQIVRFASGIPDPDERSIRVFGEFKARSGLVYKQFRPEIHLVPAFDIPRHWEVWAGVDPGYHGFAVVFFAQGPDGRTYVVDEFFSQQEPTSVRAAAVWEKARSIRDRFGPGDHLSVYVDTEDPQLVRELNIWASEHRHPLSFASLQHGKKARLAGITRIQELLMPRNIPTPPQVQRPRPKEGEPLLYFFDSLYSTWREGEETIEGSRLVWELSRYLWKRPPRNKPSAPPPDDADEHSAGGAHALAALRYGIMARVGAPEEYHEDPVSAAGEDAWVWQELHREEEERTWRIGEE